MIKLDEEASEGESLDQQVILAVQEANRLQRQANLNDPTRASQDLAESMLRDKSQQDSTYILAQQIQSLQDMEQENESLTLQVRQTMEFVTNIEKTLRRKQAES